MRRAGLALVGLVLGCSDGATTTPDAGSNEAGAKDAGAMHAGGMDAGAAGVSDARAIDAGAGEVACGCHGQAGCAVWKDVYVTWYGFNDNSCGSEAMHGCNDIADPGLGPKKHEAATAGAGTYDDPSTAAASDVMDPGHVYETAGGVTLKPGTRLYNPEVQQYFLFEDSCLECGDEYACKRSPDDTDDPPPPAGCKVGQNLHVDFWMGPNDRAQPSSLGACEDDATLGSPYAGTGTIVVNPPPDLPVRTRLLYAGSADATGGCFTASQAAVASCP